MAHNTKNKDEGFTTYYKVEENKEICQTSAEEKDGNAKNSPKENKSEKPEVALHQ